MYEPQNIHPTNLGLIHLQSPFARPTPTVAPVMHWVVDTGSESLVAVRTVTALASSIQNPRLGEISVSRLPNVLMTWYPYVSRPSTIPPPPKQSTQMGILTRSGMVPVDHTWYAVEKRTIAFETSLAPCVNDAAAAVRTWSDEYTYSARLSVKSRCSRMYVFNVPF
ncbi:hypothetical protein J3458_004312 [Metarhizium acridum]|uniref:uncharacterized protein n=1 Tax=Metarhizium acridum TaxID=92637 RepID=UPI001C6B8441|nr:hypothetical protein J3458_004312 [Metarhizium acridum]